MPTKTVDLKPDFSLLNPDFEGYKLSLESLPVYSVALNNSRLPLQVLLNSSQYSVQHVKTYGNRDLLTWDPWSQKLIYLDSNGGVNQCDPEKNPLSFQLVHSLVPPANGFSVTPSFSFPSSDIVVVSDGCGLLFFKKCVDFWTPLHVSPDGALKDLVDAVLLDSFESTPENASAGDSVLRIVHVVLQRVKSSDAEEKPGEAIESRTSAFVSQLVWLSFRLDKDSLCTERVFKYESLSSADFAAIGRNGCSLTVASARPFVRVCPPDELENTETAPSTVNESSGYIWSQTADDLTISFGVGPDVSKADIDFALNASNVEIKLKGEKTLLSGRLHGAIEKDACAWTLADSMLEVTLAKGQLCVWERVVEGDSTPETLSHSTDAVAVHESLKHLTTETWGADPDVGNKAYNAQELEDCDFGLEEFATLSTFGTNRSSPEVQCSIAANQFLFSTTTSPGDSPALCLRHDVDGVLWQPTIGAESASRPFKHLATLHAFGYISASKAKRRFLTAANDFSFAVVADVDHHAYVYRQDTKLENADLRNRKSGKRLTSVAQQHVVSLKNADEILGVVAVAKRLFLLTSTSLLKVAVGETMACDSGLL